MCVDDCKHPLKHNYFHSCVAFKQHFPLLKTTATFFAVAGGCWDSLEEVHLTVSDADFFFRIFERVVGKSLMIGKQDVRAGEE